MTSRRTHRVALLILVMAMVLAGCTLSREPDPDVPASDEVRQAAAEAAPRVDDQLSALLADRTPIFSTRRDTCAAGQSNWKVRQPHQWECTLSAGALVAGGGVEQGIREQERTAIAAGCTPYVNDTQGYVEDAEWLITRYWRPRPADETAKDMPALRYDCAGAAAVVRLTDRQDEPTLLLPCPTTPGGRDATLVCEQPDGTELGRLLAEQDDPLPLYVEVEQRYHDEKW